MRWGMGAIATAAFLISTPLPALSETVVRLDGAGATSLMPLFEAYLNAYTAQTDIPITYLGIGSGDGVRHLQSGTIDFIGTDVPVSSAEAAGVREGVISIPIAVSAIALIYNLPGIPELKLSRDTYADIFLGRITNWNDPRIAADNPNVSLPDLPIRLVVRADASGESYIFTGHLNHINPEIGKQLGESATPRWVGSVMLERGNQGIIQEVQRHQGSLGYVDYAYAFNQDLQTVSLENLSGEFVQPSVNSATQALSSIASPGIIQDLYHPEVGYPIIDVKWIAFYQNYYTEDTAEAIRQLMLWMFNEGQTLNEGLGYLPLPDHVVQKVEEMIQTSIDVDPDARRLPVIAQGD